MFAPRIAKPESQASVPSSPAPTAVPRRPVRRAGSPPVRNRAAPPIVPWSGPLFVQRACAECDEEKEKAALPVSPKLLVGSSSDPLEREADRVADQLMSAAPASQQAAAGRPDRVTAAPASGGTVQRMCAACENEEEGGDGRIQRRETSAVAPAMSDAPILVHNVLHSGGGAPLDPGTRADFEPKLGIDLGGVRVHTGSRAAESARAINARAYTSGTDVVFGTGQYSPQTSDGKRLIAHELAHVAQQASSPGIIRRAITTDACGKADLHRVQIDMFNAMTSLMGTAPKSAAAVKKLLELFGKLEPAEAIDTISRLNCHADGFSIRFYQYLQAEVRARAMALLQERAGATAPKLVPPPAAATGARSPSNPASASTARVAPSVPLASPAPKPAGTPATPLLPCGNTPVDQGGFLSCTREGLIAYFHARKAKDTSAAATALGQLRSLFLRPRLKFTQALLDAVREDERRRAGGEPRRQAPSPMDQVVWYLLDRDDKEGRREVIAALEGSFVKAPEPAPAVRQTEHGGDSASGEEVLSVDEILTRYRLLDAALEELADSESDAADAQVASAEARRLSVDAQATIASQHELLSEDEQRRHSKTVRLAAEILDRVGRLLPELEKDREALQSSTSSTYHQTKYAAAVGAVRHAYVDAVAKCLTPDAVKAFNHAEEVAKALPKSLLEVDLQALTAIPGRGSLEEAEYQQFLQWKDWVREKFDLIGTKAAALEVARERAPEDILRLYEDLTLERELFELSLRGLAHMSNAFAALAYVRQQANVLPTAYTSTARILQKCLRMRDAAITRDAKELRELLESHEKDPDIQAFYKGLPIVAYGSRFLISIAVTFVAGYVAAGVGALAARGALAAGVGETSLLLSSGTLVVEALSFTLASRRLSSMIPGQGPDDSLVADLIWNLGLFAVLTGVSSGVRSALVRRGLPALSRAAGTIAAFPVLQFYGALRYRVAKQQWPSSAELGQMTADNLLMMAVLTMSMGAVRGLLGGPKEPAALAAFHRKYGIRFETLEVARRTLGERIMELGRSTEKIPPEKAQELKDKAKVIEDEVAKILSEAKADKSIEIDKIRAELDALGKVAPEGSAELLEREIGLLSPGERVGLRGAGSTRMFSYKWGTTGALEAALRKLNAIVKKSVRPNGLQTITATLVQGEPPVIFQERAELEPEQSVDMSRPDVQRLLSEFHIQSWRATLLVRLLLERELAKNPLPNADAAKQLSGPLREVRKYLQQVNEASTDPVETAMLTMGPEAAKLQGSPLVKEAQKIAGEGLFEDKSWLRAREEGNFNGALAEWLWRREVTKLAGQQNGRVLANVHFVGDAFADEAKTIPLETGKGKPIVNTDVASELDYLIVVDKPGGIMEYTTVVNAKSAEAGELSAVALQNAAAHEALDAHAENRTARVPEKGGGVRYATVKSIKATDLQTGTGVDLTGKVRPAAKVKEETLGPKGAKGYSRTLPFTRSEITMLVKLLREVQMMRHLETR